MNHAPPHAAAPLMLLRLTSPALPVGGFSYSRGLEHAVHAGWVHDRRSAAAWIGGVLAHGVARLDVPVLARLHRTATRGDGEQFASWARLLDACRETRELQQEDRTMGRALMRLLRSLGMSDDEQAELGYTAAFAKAAVWWHIPERACLEGYLWACSESQVSAAVRLVPLGQTDGQRILGQLIAAISDLVDEALALEDDELGSVATGLAIGSCLHETQYSRLFRS